MGRLREAGLYFLADRAGNAINQTAVDNSPLKACDPQDAAWKAHPGVEYF